jgi:hypothetical protein
MEAISLCVPSPDQIELSYRFDLLHLIISEIFDSLKLMELELAAGEIPVFLLEPAFDPMRTYWEL